MSGTLQNAPERFFAEDVLFAAEVAAHLGAVILVNELLQLLAAEAHHGALYPLPAAPRARNAPVSLHFLSQTLHWFVMGACDSHLHAGGLSGISGRIPMEIVTHPAVGMCYNSMTFQVLVNFTISFTGATLANSR